MTDVQYAMYKKIKKTYGIVNRRELDWIVFLSFCLVLSYIVFLLSFSVPFFFGAWLMIIRLVIAFVFIISVLGFFCFVRRMDTPGRRAVSLEKILANVNDILRKYESDSNDDIQNFITKLSRKGREEQKVAWDIFVFTSGTLNTLVVLPFLTFIIGIFTKVVSNQEMINSLEDIFRAFGLFVFTSFLLVFIEFMIGRAIYSYMNTKYEPVIHYLENILFIRSKNVSILDFANLTINK
ncbi:hypothetical protein HLG73_06795 [Lacticaseibacillus paracasei]|uniref:hypothetical protein n=1 Tax=Lacticaseibacillus paracasei TaxID=1597 RepID=UPI0023590B61|nr:hypothetical protein [Lacticaseibacillus paracasei]WCZ19061.1 hypothetical protein HLG73_06795 [Lacticaseibacillus paracasei]